MKKVLCCVNFKTVLVCLDRANGCSCVPAFKFLCRQWALWQSEISQSQFWTFIVHIIVIFCTALIMMQFTAPCSTNCTKLNYYVSKLENIDISEKPIGASNFTHLEST